MEGEGGMRKRKKLISFKMTLIIFIIVAILGINKAWETSRFQPASLENSWNLILVNRHNYIPQGYEIDLTELSNGKQVDERIYESLQEMFVAAEKENVYLVVVEAYRTEEEQQKLMDEKIEEYIQKEYPRFLAEFLAKKWVAEPGTSEHQLGIAVDINPDYSKSDRNKVYTWLAENSYKYGFIYRYPEDKTHITGISNEPWHYRYVGIEVAEEMYKQDICLEEYLK